MRKEFSHTIEKLAVKDEKIIFITGDLGYSAFENLRTAIGNRFINAGVAEQNMVGVAAGMAHKGYKVFCYSIAPFVVYRCLEQFRNDVCLHNLPVFLVGNGGGYGYGIMGSTHHALEDIACLSGLQNVKCHVPAFNDDVERMLNNILKENGPAYLRLGNSKPAPASQTWAAGFNSVMKAPKAEVTVIAMGPVINNILSALENNNLKDKADVFTVTTLPFTLTTELKNSITKTGKVLIAEEHVRTGGAAEQLSLRLLEEKIPVKQFIALNAKGYPEGLYGDQAFHQTQSGLDAVNIRNVSEAINMTSHKPKKNKPVAAPPTAPVKPGNNKPLLSLNIVIAILFLVFCFMLFKNISYPLLWNDEAETAMNARQILRYGYPKGHDEKNSVFIPDESTWIGYKPIYDANIAMPWGNYYFAVIGVWMADHVKDIYMKTALVRIPFATIGLAGMIIFMLSLSGFFVNRLHYQRFIICFILIELFSVSLFLHMREARYYSMVIFITSCFFWVFFNHFFFKRYSALKYILLMTLVLFFAYQVTFIAFVVFCMVMGLFELRYRIAEFLLKLKQKATVTSLIGEQFKLSLVNLAPVLIALVIIAPFLVFFETFTMAARASAHYGYSFEMYKQHIQRIIYVLTTQEFLYPALFASAAQVIVFLLSRNDKTKDKKAAALNKLLQKITFFLTMFFICYGMMVSRLPFIWVRYFIVLQPVMIIILLIDMIIVFNFMSSHLPSAAATVLKGSFATVIVLIFILNAGTKIDYLKNYVYQLSTQLKGPLDYLIPFIQNKYPKTDTLVLATNYEELSYMYYLNCKVTIGYTFKNLKEDLKYTPDIVIFRKRWGHDPTVFNQLLQKAHYERTSFPVLDYNVNNIAELDFVIQHQFKTPLTDDEREKTDIFTLVK